MKAHELEKISAEILTELGVKSMPAERQAEVAAGLIVHFNDIVLEVVIAHLPPSDVDKLNHSLMDDPSNFYATLAEVVARIPNASLLIEKAVATELVALKTQFAKLKE